MSKRPPAREVSAVSGRSLGDLLYKLGNPARQALSQVPADEEDWREFLEAARKLFAHKTDQHARRFLKMPINTPRRGGELVKALVREIDGIRQEGDAANDPVQRHRLQLALLIDDVLKEIRDELTMRRWTTKILKEADRITSAKRSQDGAKREVGPDRTKQRWAASQIERLRHMNPDISVTKIATALYATARKEKPGCWPNDKSLRAWLYRNRSLLEREKMAR